MRLKPLQRPAKSQPLRLQEFLILFSKGVDLV